MPFPCDHCEALRINGVRCHETGCQDAWRDCSVPCFECGCDFMRQDRFQQTCEDCINDNPNDGLSCCNDVSDEEMDAREQNDAAW